MENTTSRRAVLAAALAAPALVAIGTTSAQATSLAPTSTIEAYWAARCTAYRELEADPEFLESTEVANHYWNRIDATEVAILAHPDTSTRAAELRMWLAWTHIEHSCGANVDNMINLGDAAGLTAVRDRLDWHGKLIFAAILNLRGEG